MYAVQHYIRILVITLLVHHARCQDGFGDRDMLRYQQMSPNDGHVGAMAGYNNNMQRDHNQQALGSLNMQYQIQEDVDNTNDYNRADRTRTRKVYRIKNPFQHQLEENNQQQDGNTDSHDSGTGASNQYATMQYSLPPEDFLQQMRAEQYYQQHSTPAPTIGYTATPQPQYQYSTISPQYDNNQQSSNQLQQLEQQKSHSQYLSNPYQYTGPNTFSLDGVQSTPSPVTPYLSTALPNNQLVGTPSNSYVSSSSPIFLSSPPNLQYLSSPLSSIQTGTPDYLGNRVTTTIGSNGLNYDTNDQNKKMQIDHYDNSAHGVRYPINMRQYQTEYGSSTPSPSSPSYSDSRESWQNQNNNGGANAIPKSIQDVSYTQYQNYPYTQQDNRNDGNVDNVNSDTHRIGTVPTNNVYFSYMQPDYQGINNGKGRTRDVEHETGQPDFYSNGEYGWKMTNKRPLTNNEAYPSNNYQRYQPSLQSDGEAVSQMNFHMDTSKQYYDVAPKTNNDNLEAQEFAKAAARAHENLKQQQQNYYTNNYDNNNNNNYNNNNNPSASANVNSYYNNFDKQQVQQNSKYQEQTQSNQLYKPQPDLITASPFYYNRDNNNFDNKQKQPFDHAKALKNIVPIDVSNVLNSDTQSKGVIDNNNKYNIQNYGKDQLDQNRLNFRTLTDLYYKDKNSIYGLNIKSKPDDYLGSDSSKLFEPNPYYAKQQQSQDYNNQGLYNGGRQSYNVQSGNLPDNLQSSANVHQGIHRPQNQYPTDINSILKLNDVPHQLTQGLSSDSLKFHNSNFDQGGLPTQLPIRLNQDVTTHQLDVTSNLLSKLLMKNQQGMPFNRPDLDTQSNMLSTINGYKVVNPFNVDLKLVADMLKGKANADDAHMISIRDQYNKPPSLKLDFPQLQFLLKNDNAGSLTPMSDTLNLLSGPFLEIYNGGRHPYQGVKYSRSQEEEESIVPIADSSNNHPIGAVMEQDEQTNERDDGTVSDTTALEEPVNHEEERIKKPFMSGHRSIGERHRHPNSLIGRHMYQRKYPKDVEEPYPLLKPPPLSLRGRANHLKKEKYNRRRRLNKPKVFRILKTEPLFEAESDDDDSDSVPVVLRPPPPVAEAKSDVVDEAEDSS